MKPTPQQVRDWLKSRTVAKTPPPTPEEIRRQLGWFVDTKRECAR